MEEEGDTARLGPSSSSEIVVSTPEVGGDQPETMTRRDDSTLEWLAVQSVCTVSIFAGLLGYDIGVMSGALLPLSRDLSFTSSQEEVAVGCLNFVSAAGSIGGGFMYNKLGAVRCVRIAIILYALGMFIIACSYGFAQIFVGRVVCGLGVGLGFAICPQYIAGRSPRRGAASSSRASRSPSTSDYAWDTSQTSRWSPSRTPPGGVGSCSFP